MVNGTDNRNPVSAKEHAQMQEEQGKANMAKEGEKVGAPVAPADDNVAVVEEDTTVVSGNGDGESFSGSTETSSFGEMAAAIGSSVSAPVATPESSLPDINLDDIDAGLAEAEETVAAADEIYLQRRDWAEKAAPKLLKIRLAITRLSDIDIVTSQQEASLASLKKQLAGLESVQDTDPSLWEAINFSCTLLKIKECTGEDNSRISAILDEVEKSERLRPSTRADMDRIDDLSKQERFGTFVVIWDPRANHIAHFVPEMDTKANKALVVELIHLSKRAKKHHETILQEEEAQMDISPLTDFVNGKEGIYKIVVPFVKAETKDGRFQKAGEGFVELRSRETSADSLTVHPVSGHGRFGFFNEMAKNREFVTFYWLQAGDVYTRTRFETNHYWNMRNTVSWIREALRNVGLSFPEPPPHEPCDDNSEEEAE